jgi:tetratricopeptide (TPR) repeat protein
MLDYVQMLELEQEWLEGKATLGAVSNWTAEEIRLVADIGYSLSEQGRVREAITVFEGLAALAPATAYFQATLGALWLREGNFSNALEHLNRALKIDANNIVTLVNRGEVFLKLSEREMARKDLLLALKIGLQNTQKFIEQSVEERSLTRAKALLTVLDSSDNNQTNLANKFGQNNLALPQN